MDFDTTSLLIMIVLIVAAVGLLVLLNWRTSNAPSGPSGSADPGQNGSQESRLSRVNRVLAVALFFGLATGVIHVLWAVIQRDGRGLFLFVGPSMLWMAPLAYTTIFVGIGIMLGAVVLVLPRNVSFRLLVTVFSWLGVTGLLLPFDTLSTIAIAVLAAGLAVQIGNILNRHSGDRLAMMKKTSAAAIVALIILIFTVQSWDPVAERVLARSLPAARPGAPNVLLLVMDTVRAANMSLYDYDRKTTPGLERWAAEGTTFDMALSTSPWTLKSHATMFTGLYPSQVSGDFQRRLDLTGPMLAESFRDQGYMTGGFVANLLYTSYESGLTPGFVHYDDYQVSLNQVLFHSWIAHTRVVRQIISNRSPRGIIRAFWPPSLQVDFRQFHNRTYERKSADEVTSSFLDWQVSVGDKPFFAFLNYFDAHQPYRPLPASADRFSSEETTNVDEYDARIAFIDSEIDRLLDELRVRGVLDNTIVIVTSDHGEQFGEHGLEDHANSLYLPLLHVPLLVRYPPRVPPDRRVAVSTTLRDLAATVVDLAELPDAEFPGASLAPEWEGEPRGDGSAIVAQLEVKSRPSSSEPVRFGPIQSSFDGRFHYILRGDGYEELYDYRSDAAEERNLAYTAEGRRQLPRLRTMITSISTR